MKKPIVKLICIALAIIIGITGIIVLLKFMKSPKSILNDACKDVTSYAKGYYVTYEDKSTTVSLYGKQTYPKYYISYEENIKKQTIVYIDKETDEFVDVDYHEIAFDNDEVKKTSYDYYNPTKGLNDDKDEGTASLSDYKKFGWGSDTFQSTHNNRGPEYAAIDENSPEFLLKGYANGISAKTFSAEKKYNFLKNQYTLTSTVESIIGTSSTTTLVIGKNLLLSYTVVGTIEDAALTYTINYTYTKGSISAAQVYEMYK